MRKGPNWNWGSGRGEAEARASKVEASTLARLTVTILTNSRYTRDSDGITRQL